MRIGVVLFGHLRSYKHTYSSFEKLKSTLSREGELDIFCHTWDIEESVSAAWWKDHKADNPPPASVNKEEIISKFSPVLYEIEPSKQFEEPSFPVKSLIPLAGMVSMLYSQTKSFELLKAYEQRTGKKYDVIIKSRYDILYDIDPRVTSLLTEAVKKNMVYLPSSNPYELAGAFSDVLAICSRQQADIYFEFNNNTGEAARLFHQAGYRQMVPELLMSVFLKMKGVTIDEIDGLRISILRMNLEKFQVSSCRSFEDNNPLCFFQDTVTKCRQFLPRDDKLLTKNVRQAVKKYIGWIDTRANENELEDYARFFLGDWILPKKVGRLAALTKTTKIFNIGVMRDFFETALWNATYSVPKKLLIASVLARKSSFGLFYFKVIKKQTVG